MQKAVISNQDTRVSDLQTLDEEKITESDTTNQNKDDLIPTKNLIVSDSDRRITSMWLSRSIHSRFVSNVHGIGRKSCDLIEPFEASINEAIESAKAVSPNIVFPLAQISFNLTLNVTEKYSKRGPKEKEPIPAVCPFGGVVRKNYCLNHCSPENSNSCWIRHRFLNL